MNSKSREELVEQYEDAAFALLMSAYAEQEGNRLLREFEEAKAKGEVPEVPAALDARCRKIIRQAYEKQRRLEQARRILCTAGRTAAILFITLGMCTTLIFSVEAIRIPVINFLIEQHERYTSIDFTKETVDTQSQDSSAVAENDEGELPLANLVPSGYAVSRYDVKEDGSVTIIYKNTTGNSIFFATSALEGNMNFDTENANYENVVIAGYSGILVQKNSSLKITWFDENCQQVYTLRAIGLDFAEFWELAEQTAQSEMGG